MYFFIFLYFYFLNFLAHFFMENLSFLVFLCRYQKSVLKILVLKNLSNKCGPPELGLLNNLRKNLLIEFESVQLRYSNKSRVIRSGQFYQIRQIAIVNKFFHMEAILDIDIIHHNKNHFSIGHYQNKCLNKSQVNFSML